MDWGTNIVVIESEGSSRRTMKRSEAGKAKSSNQLMEPMQNIRKGSKLAKLGVARVIPQEMSQKELSHGFYPEEPVFLGKRKSRNAEVNISCKKPCIRKSNRPVLPYRALDS